MHAHLQQEEKEEEGAYVSGAVWEKREVLLPRTSGCFYRKRRRTKVKLAKT